MSDATNRHAILMAVQGCHHTRSDDTNEDPLRGTFLHSECRSSQTRRPPFSSNRILLSQRQERRGSKTAGFLLVWKIITHATHVVCSNRILSQIVNVFQY